MLLTRAPVAGGRIAPPPLPLDLHVLGLSLAFILSQDQTLRCCILFFLLPKNGCGACPFPGAERAPLARLFIVAFLVIDRVGCNPLRDCALSCTTSFSIVSLSMFFTRFREAGVSRPAVQSYGQFLNRPNLLHFLALFLLFSVNFAARWLL